MAVKNGYYRITASGSFAVTTTDATLQRVIGYGAAAGNLTFVDCSGTANLITGTILGSANVTNTINAEYNIPVYNGLTVVASGIAGTVLLTWQRAS